jgi:NDP-sugar pyrophosphorylase family protein
MAGRGSRFSEAGYLLPKPLIPIHGVPMIKAVVDNLAPKMPHRFVFVCQADHIEKYDLAKTLKSYAKHVEVISVHGITEGQVCTVLKAKHLINNDEPLMTANSDQFIDFDINEYLEDMNARQLDGLIMVMKSDHPKWSYVKTNEQGHAIQTAEKQVISTDATVGIYNFRQGKDLVQAAEQMIKENMRVNNEFYTCPCYNYLIQEDKKIGVYSIGAEYAGMYGLGIPQDLNFFLKHEVSKRLLVET